MYNKLWKTILITLLTITLASSVNGVFTIGDVEDGGNAKSDTDQTIEIGTLSGKIVYINGTAIKGLPVQLEKPLGTIILNTTTNSDGEYSFMSLEANETYRVSFIYLGVPYFKDVAVINSTKTDFNVYDVTTNDENIAVSTYHKIISPEVMEGHLGVTEYIIYKNTGDKTFNNSRLKAWLPEDRYHFETSVMDCCVEQLENGILFYPMTWESFTYIKPGEQYQLLIEYCVGYTSSEYTLMKKIDYPTDALYFFIENKPDIAVENARGFEDKRLVSFSNKEYYELTGSNLNADEYISVKITGLSIPQAPSIRIIWIAALVAIAGSAIAYPVVRKKIEEKSSIEGLEEAKALFFSKLVRLEKDYNEGKIPEDAYNRLKSKYKAGVMTLIQRMDRSNAKKTELSIKHTGSLSELYMERDTLLSTLKKLETDYRARRLSKDVYEKIQAKYKDRIAKVMERLKESEKKY